MVSRGVFILLWPHKDSVIFLIFILITEFNFLKLQGPLTFFDYAVFCEIEILIETRAVSLFPEKKSNNLWSPSYMQDLIKSLMEVTRTASAEHSYFLYMKSMSSVLEARQRYLLFMVGLCVCLCKNPKHRQVFIASGQTPQRTHGSAVTYWVLLNSHWLSIFLRLLPAVVWDIRKVISLFCWTEQCSKAGVYRTKWEVLHFLLWYSRESC